MNAVVRATGTAVVSLLVLVLTASTALTTATGQAWDERAMNSVYAGPDARLSVLSLLGRVSIGLVLAVMVACVVTALLRGRLRWAIGAVVVIAGANVTTQLLKHVVLDRVRFENGLWAENSLPSGHTTVVASAAAAALLVAPPALRAMLAAGGAAATTLTGASTIAAGWHRPADIVAALAVSLLWAGAVAAVVSRGTRHVAGTRTLSALGAAAGLVGLVALGVRPTMGWDGLLDSVLVLGFIALLTAMFTAAAAAIGFDDAPSDAGPSAATSSAVGVTGTALSADRARA